MIIDIVTFIIERGAQIIQFVNAVLDAVIAIAGGRTGGVPALIEKPSPCPSPSSSARWPPSSASAASPKKSKNSSKPSPNPS
jgi:hypothetical protein